MLPDHRDNAGVTAVGLELQRCRLFSMSTLATKKGTAVSFDLKRARVSTAGQIRFKMVTKEGTS